MAYIKPYKTQNMYQHGLEKNNLIKKYKKSLP